MALNLSREWHKMWNFLECPWGFKGVEALNAYKQHKEAAASRFPELDIDKVSQGGTIQDGKVTRPTEYIQKRNWV